MEMLTTRQGRKFASAMVLMIFALALGVATFATTARGEKLGGSAEASSSNAPAIAQAARDAEARAQQLPLDFEGSTFVAPAAFVEKGRLIASDIPTPPGYPLDVQWAEGAEQGGDTVAGMTAVAEYNALCKWFDAAFEDPKSSQISAGISAASRWPSVRGTEAAKRLVAPAVDALATGDVAASKSRIAGICAPAPPKGE